ncbi:LON peptidase substrate-binding domain-containing protein [Mycolicibacter minnesotensis]
MTVLPMFPLEAVLLPGEELSLQIFEPRYVTMVGELMRGKDPRFGVVLIARGREVGGGEQRNKVGVIAHLTHCTELRGRRYALRCAMGDRLLVSQWLDDDPYPRAVAEVWPDEPGELVGTSQLRDLQDRVATLHQQMAAAGHRWAMPRQSALPETSHPGPTVQRQLYELTGRIPMGPADRYAVLAAPSLSARLAAVREAIDSVSARIEFGLGR